MEGLLLFMGELKLYTLFTADFGKELCRMESYIPPDNPISPQDMKSIRYSWRYAEEAGKKCGFLFVNNYVRHHHMEDHIAKEFTFGSVSLPLRSMTATIIFFHSIWQ
jgi:hypothetical protein